MFLTPICRCPRLVSAAQKLRTLSPTDWVRSETRHQFVRRVRRALFATLRCDQGQCSFEQLIRQAHVSQAALNCSPNRWVCSIPPQLSSLGARCALIQNTCEVGATFTAASFCSGFLCSVMFRASCSSLLS